ncbi:hypothetical protein AB0I91_34940 [Actinosynnema sp. NPDC049800]
MTATVEQPEDGRSEPREPAGGSGQILADLNTATIATIPTLVLMVLLVAANDRVLLRVVAARGDLIGLLMVLISPLLPLIVAGFIFLLLLRWIGGYRPRALLGAGAIGGLLLFVAAPVSIVLGLAVLAVLTWIYIRVRGQSGSKLKLLVPPTPSRPLKGAAKGVWSGRGRLSLSVTVVIQAFATVAPLLDRTDFGGGVAEASRSIVLGGLPVEVIAYGSGPEYRLDTFRVVQAGDQVTTVVTESGAVSNLWNSDISHRVPCNDGMSYWDKPLIFLGSDTVSPTPECSDIRETGLTKRRSEGS